MNRLSFIRKMVFGSVAVAVSHKSLASNTEEYSFDDIFYVHNGNNILIYPKYDSVFYNRLKESFGHRIAYDRPVVYLPENKLSIPYKDKYRWEDLLPIKYYFECVYQKHQKYAIQNNVIFRFIRNGDDRMYLETFITNN